MQLAVRGEKEKKGMTKSGELCILLLYFIITRGDSAAEHISLERLLMVQIWIWEFLLGSPSLHVFFRSPFAGWPIVGEWKSVSTFL